jgi:hypothetical protein
LRTVATGGGLNGFFAPIKQRVGFRWQERGDLAVMFE